MTGTKRPLLSLLLILLFSLFSQNGFSQGSILPVKTEEGLYKINMGELVMEIDPEMAGRIVSFSIKGKEVLSGPDAHESNYGSTFWTSPQSDWNWPPRAAHDSNPYKAVVSGNRLILTGDYDSLTGLRIIKTFRANPTDTSIAVKYTLQNLSKEKKKVAAWEITRVPTGGLSFFPKQSERPASYSTLKVKDISGIIWYQSDPKNLKEMDNKLFINGREGWLGHVYKDLLFIKKFPDIPPGTSPEKEEEVEIYVNPVAGYIELENQGPYKVLNPVESLDYEVNWYLKELPEGFKANEGNLELVNYVRNVLK
ncbi:MAG TPA: DUF4380 domain-containing protein [Cytophagales bacterium]|nr:DUF4380 domain-containing protein [Cytophagales bacterium]